MVAAQNKLGHNVSVLTTAVNGYSPCELLGVTVKAIPCVLPIWRWAPGFGYALKAQVGTADIVHLHTIWEHPTWSAARCCRTEGIPYIVRPCGMLESWSLSQSPLRKRLYLRGLGRTMLRHAAAIHFTSESERANSAAVCGHTNNIVIPIGLNDEAYADQPPTSAFRSRYPELGEKKIVLFLGRLHTKKQPDIVIRAFVQATKAHPDTVLVMAGTGDAGYLTALRNLANDLGIANRVIFTDLLLGAAVYEAYRAATLFVLPSLQENFGIAVAEAMAAGCPVVVSNQVSLASEVSAAGAGIVCASEVSAVARSISRLLADEGLRRTMGENGHNLVLKKFTWEQIARDLVDVYCDIVEKKQRHAAWRN